MEPKSKLEKALQELRTVRQQTAYLREAFNIDLGDIQNGYENTIREILRTVGCSEGIIDFFWEITDPE